MSYPCSYDTPARPTRYRSINQPNRTYTMAASFNNGSSRSMLRQHATEVFQHEQTQTMASSVERFVQPSPYHTSQLSQHDSMSSINTRLSNHWFRQLPLSPMSREQSPRVVHMKATRLATALLLAEPFKLKSIDQLYDEAIESDEEREGNQSKHTQRGLRGVQRSTTRAQSRPLFQSTMMRPRERPLTQWPVFPANPPVCKSPPNEVHRDPGRIKVDVPARKDDNIPSQASYNPQATDSDQTVFILKRQLFSDLLTGRTAWRYKDSTANVEYHEYLRDSTLLANKARNHG